MTFLCRAGNQYLPVNVKITNMMMWSIHIVQNLHTYQYKLCILYKVLVQENCLASSGAVKDSVVGEERLVQYLLAILNTRNTPLHWKHLRHQRVERCIDDKTGKSGESVRISLPRRRKLLNESDIHYIEVLSLAV